MTTNNTAPSFTFELNDDTVHTVISALVMNAAAAKESREKRLDEGEDGKHDQNIINQSHRLIVNIAQAAAEGVGYAYALGLLAFADGGWGATVDEMPTDETQEVD